MTTEKGELHNSAHQMLWRPLQTLKKSQKRGGSSTPLCVESKIGSSGLVQLRGQHCNEFRRQQRVDPANPGLVENLNRSAETLLYNVTKSQQRGGI